MREHSNSTGSYHEGPYTMDVSGSTGVVSLTAHWEPYAFGNRTKLKVKVVSPQQGKYILKAEELSPKHFYWFQTKVRNLSAGTNTFEGWEVDRWLRRLEIPSRSLGLLAYIGHSRNRRFLPAWVYHSRLPARTRYYTAQIRLGINVAEGTWHLYQGTKQATARPVHEGTILAHSGGSCIPLRIATDKLTQPGWYTVVVNLQERSSLDLKRYSFYFYHR